MASEDVRLLQRENEDLKTRVDELEYQTSKIPVRFATGGGGGLIFYVAANKTALNALLPLEEPAVGYTTSNGHYYALSDGTWLSITHIEL